MLAKTLTTAFTSRLLRNNLNQKSTTALFGTSSSFSSSQTTETEKKGETEPEAPASAENAELKALQEQLTKKTEELADFKDKLLRALADAENVRNQMRKQVDQAKVFGIQAFSKDLFEVADILSLAIANTDPSKIEANNELSETSREQLNSMFNGLKMTDKCMLKIFEKHNLYQISPSEGDKFDPNFHEALFRVPDASKESGSIHVVTKIGFKLHDRCLRAAQVGVVQ